MKNALLGFTEPKERKPALAVDNVTSTCRGFIKGWAQGKLTDCEHDFARLLYISKNTRNNQKQFQVTIVPFS